MSNSKDLTYFKVEITGKGCGLSEKVKKLLNQLFTTHEDFKKIVDLEIMQDNEDETLCTFAIKGHAGLLFQREIKHLVNDTLNDLGMDLETYVSRWNNFG